MSEARGGSAKIEQESSSARRRDEPYLCGGAGGRLPPAATAEAMGGGRRSPPSVSPGLSVSPTNARTPSDITGPSRNRPSREP